MRHLTLLWILFAAGSLQAQHVIRDRYLVFDNESEVTRWLSANQPDLVAMRIPESDPLYAKGTAILQKVWSGFQALYPAETEGLPVPRLIIGDKPYLDGQAIASPDGRWVPDLFFITRGSAEARAGAIAGLFGHELTHMLFLDFKYRYYRVSPGSEPLGFLQANDPSAEQEETEWRKLTEVAGPVLMDELGGLPFHFVYDGKLFDLLVHIAKAHGDQSLAACRNLSVDMPEWARVLFFQVISFVDHSVHPTVAQRARIDSLTRAYRSDLSDCLGKLKVDLIAELSHSTGLSASTLRQRYAHEAEVFGHYDNAADGILGVAADTYATMKAFRKTHDLSALRDYSSEEVADDTSVRVMRFLGKTGTELEDFLGLASESVQKGSYDRCLKLLGAGVVPGYGILSDPHHSPCFRVYHLRALNTWLDAQPAG